MKNRCDKMGTVPILSQQFFSHWRQSQRKLFILNSTIEILRTHKIAAILTIAVADCEWALMLTSCQVSRNKDLMYPLYFFMECFKIKACA